jgi:hypothetical protein
MSVDVTCSLPVGFVKLFVCICECELM